MAATSATAVLVLALGAGSALSFVVVDWQTSYEGYADLRHVADDGDVTVRLSYGRSASAALKTHANSTVRSVFSSLYINGRR